MTSLKAHAERKAWIEKEPISEKAHHSASVKVSVRVCSKTQLREVNKYPRPDQTDQVQRRNDSAGMIRTEAGNPYSSTIASKETTSYPPRRLGAKKNVNEHVS
jgi:hypothetical protein